MSKEKVYAQPSLKNDLDLLHPENKKAIINALKYAVYCNEINNTNEVDNVVTNFVIEETNDN